MNRTFYLVTAIIALVAIALGISFQKQLDGQQSKLLALDTITLLPKPKAISDITLLNHLNRTMSMHDLKGRWSLLFFGFTHCPDICPSTMQTLKTVKQEVSHALTDSTGWGNYQVVFVSVDPERDTPQQLANYVPYFDSSFIGLTAEPATIKRLTQEFGVPYVQQAPDQEGNYDVDHYAGILLLNPQVQLAGLISAPLNKSKLSQDLTKLAKKFTADHETSVKPLLPQRSKQNDSSQAPSSSEPSNNTATLSLEQAWIRPAPPNVSSMAGYGILRNNTSEDIILESASSSEFGMVMIHDTVIENNIARMVHNDTLTVKANNLVELKPKGKHFMLMRPKQPLSINDSSTITFIDSKKRQYDFSISVREAP